MGPGQGSETPRLKTSPENLKTSEYLKLRTGSSEHHSPTAFPLDAWLPHVKVHSPGDLGGDRTGPRHPDGGPTLWFALDLRFRILSISSSFRVWGDHKRVLQKLCGGSVAKLKPCARTCRLAAGVELHFVRAPCRCGSFCPLVTFVIEKQVLIYVCTATALPHALWMLREPTAKHGPCETCCRVKQLRYIDGRGVEEQPGSPHLRPEVFDHELSSQIRSRCDVYRPVCALVRQSRPSSELSQAARAGFVGRAHRGRWLCRPNAQCKI